MEQNPNAGVATTEAPAQKPKSEQLVRRRPGTVPQKTEAPQAERIGRRPAKHSANRAGQQPKIPVAVIVLACLVVGFAAGALVVRQRNQAFENQAVVAVNGAVITKDQFYNRLEATAGSTVISQMVSEDLQLQFARKRGQEATNKEVNDRLEKTKKIDPSFMATLKKQGVSEEVFKKQLRLSLSQVKTFAAGFDATEAEMRDYYQKNIDPKNPKAGFYTPEQITIAVIVTKSKEKADQALAKLEKRGDFGAVAKEFSLDNSSKSGGVIPTFLKGRTKISKDKAFEDEIFNIPIGSTKGPQSHLGAWWIIRCLDKKSAKSPPPFEDVRDQCRDGVRQAKGRAQNGARIQEEFDAFAKNSIVQAFWPRYKETVRIRK